MNVPEKSSIQTSKVIDFEAIASASLETPIKVVVENVTVSPLNSECESDSSDSRDGWEIVENVRQSKRKPIKRKRKGSPDRSENPLKIPKLDTCLSPTLKVENKESLDEDDAEPKLTRAKAQALNKKILNLPPLNAPKPTPEVEVLIREEFQSDEEDEEYQPCFDEIHSDDELSTSYSDMDSQPRTPHTSSFTPDKNKGTPNYTDDGLFKIPRLRTNSSGSQSEQDYIIAKRTRSKVCLTTIPIETIESTFHPPDIPQDMLQQETDVDNNWMEFLNVLTKPLNSTLEDDDEADPEYVVADKIPVDKEELRDVNISKKELNDLIEELMKDLEDVNFTDYESLLEIPPTISKPRLNSRQRKRNDKNSPNESSIDVINDPLNTIDGQNMDFQPNLMSTPVLSNKPNSFNQQQQQQLQFQQQNQQFQPIPYNQNSTAFSPVSTIQQTIVTNTGIPSNPQMFPTSTFVPNSIAGDSSSYQVSIPIGDMNPYQGAVIQNGSIQLPQFQQVMVLVPTIDILKYHQRLNASVATSTANATFVDGTVQPLPVESPEQKNAISETIEVPLEDAAVSEQNEPKTSERKHSMNALTKYQQKLFKHLKDEKLPKKTFDASQLGFTDSQRDILDQQLRMHVQLTTQTFVQVCQHPLLIEFDLRFKRILTELKEVCEQENVTIKNLENAIQLANEWEIEKSSSNPSSVAYFDFMKKELKRYINTPRNQGYYIMKFHQDFFERILPSDVFIYPDLLPKIPIRPLDKLKKSGFAPIEDYLVAHSLERFYEQRKQAEKQLATKPRKLSLGDICRDIARHFRYFNQKAKALYPHIQSRKVQKDLLNPIQYYFLNNKAPVFQHNIRDVNLDNVICPFNQPLGSLPYAWAKYVERIKAVEHDKQINPTYYQKNVKSAAPTQPVAPRIRACRNLTNELNRELNTDSSVEQEPQEPQEQQEQLVQENQQQLQEPTSQPPLTDDNQSKTSTTEIPSTEPIEPIRITVRYQDQDIVKPSDPFTINIPIETPLNQPTSQPTPTHLINSTSNNQNSSTENIIKSTNINHNRTDQCLLTPTSSIGSSEINYFSCNESQKSSEKCWRTCQCNLIKKSSLDKSYEIDRKQTLLTSYFERSDCSQKSNSCTENQHNSGQVKRSESHQTLTRKFYEILNEFSKYNRAVGIHLFGEKHLLLASIYDCFKSFENYIEFVFKHEMSGAVKRSKNQNDESGKKSKATTSTDDAVLTDATNVPDKDSVAIKRGQKGYKTVDNTRLMVMPESPEDSNEKDLVFAQNFMDKVEDVYHNEGHTEKYIEFEKILRSFNPAKEKAVDLYHKLETFFNPDHPELTELFLTFLLPGQAAQVGKFMEHFMMTNMSNFLNKLNIFFNKQPAQIRKIYACLKELSEEENLKMEQIKSKVLPLLKGNQLLTEWFLQCFPNEQYSDSPASEYEYLRMRRDVEVYDDAEVFEQLPQTEILADPTENPCGLRYINGRIYYGSRIMLPGKLAFMSGSVTSPKIGTESSKSVDQMKDGSRCLHSIKHYGDARIREQQKSHSEIDGPTSSSGETAASTSAGTSGQDGNDDDGKRNYDSSQTDDKQTIVCLPDITYAPCDETIMKAHAVRLNPSTYATGIMTSEDASNILRLSATLDKLTDAERESLSKSPKKQTYRLTAMSQKAQRKSPKSPSAKKLNKPVGCKKAVEMAKKLQKMIGSCSANQQKKSTASITKERRKKSDQGKRKEKVDKTEKHDKSDQSYDKMTPMTSTNDTNSTEIKTEMKSDSEASNQSTSQPIVTESSQISNPNTSIDIDNNDDVVSKRETNMSPGTLDWSREEDKLVLEHIQLGFVSELDFVRNLQTQLPNRSEVDIHVRYKFLMDVIATIKSDTN